MGGYGMAAKMRELTEQNMQEFVKEVEKRKIPLHSVLIAQHGNLLFEKYYAPYCRNKLQRMFSVTKSFTSLAIGDVHRCMRLLLPVRIRKAYSNIFWKAFLMMETWKHCGSME